MSNARAPRAASRLAPLTLVAAVVLASAVAAAGPAAADPVATPPTSTASTAVAASAATLTAPASVNAGQSFTATASNMGPGETVTFTVSGGGSGVARPADQSGAASAALTVPADAGSSVTVTATGATTGLAPTATVSVPPATITTTDTSVPPGATIGVRGSGYPAGTTVAFTGVTGPTPAPTVAADGTFKAKVKLPATLTTTTVTVVATAGSRAARVDLLVPPAAVRSVPDRAAPGQTMLIAGSGFRASSKVQVSGVATTTSVDRYGTFAEYVTVPLGATDALTVTAVGGGRRAGVTIPVPAAALYGGPSAAPGGTVHVTGYSFPVGSTVTLSGVAPTTTPTTVDSYGGFQVSAVVPTDATDPVMVTASAGGRQATATIPVPAAALDPLAGPLAPGATLSVRGSGLLGNTPVQFTGAVGPDPAVVTDAGGAFRTTVTLPATASGVVTITAATGSRQASASTTVPAATIAVPATVAAGSSATITGTSFAVGEPLTVSASTSGRQVTFPSPVPPAGSGTYDGYVAIPFSVPATACPVSTTVTVTGVASGRTATATFATPAGSTLLSGCAAGAGSVFSSPSGQYQLAVQGDGDLVLSYGSRQLWHTGTSAPAAGLQLVLQDDGNLVLYSGSRPIWNSGTRGTTSGSTLVLQDDGNLVLYDAAGRPVWYTGFATTDRMVGGDYLKPGWSIHTASGAWRLVMQFDGNLVLYKAGVAYWNSRTSQSGGFAAMGYDGNFVIYSPWRTPLFTTGTNALGARLVVQEDGNLVVYDLQGRPIWVR